MKTKINGETVYLNDSYLLDVRIANPNKNLKSLVLETILADFNNLVQESVDIHALGMKYNHYTIHDLVLHTIKNHGDEVVKHDVLIPSYDISPFIFDLGLNMNTFYKTLAKTPITLIGTGKNGKLDNSSIIYGIIPKINKSN